MSFTVILIGKSEAISCWEEGKSIGSSSILIKKEDKCILSKTCFLHKCLLIALFGQKCIFLVPFKITLANKQTMINIYNQENTFLT